MIEESKKAELLKMNETETFFLIDECGGFIWRMNHEMSHGRIPIESHAGVHEDMMAVKELQQFVVDNLMRFGVDPLSAKDRENGDYWKWFGFWDKWRNGLSDEDWDNMIKLIKNNESYEKYLPETTWKD